ncbi:hypothetical protein PIB30_013399 [Stylosanthes scabra]|uniref:Uncharacterized protein n=1 Tax=Stylosanthes scabra TaxID=79078 RepID=A0ABU6W5T0_9FABA|nr:hypothetical protein [Stylosanthes scabra]
MENDGVSSRSRRSGSALRAERYSSSTKGFFVAKEPELIVLWVSLLQAKDASPHYSFFLWLDRHTAKFNRKEGVKCEEVGEHVNEHFSRLRVDNRLGDLEDRIATIEKKKRLYGWVEEAVFTQPSVVLRDDLPELCRSMRLTEDVTAEGDFVLEAVGPSDRLPIQASGDGPHYLWVYQELFTRLGVRLPFTDFQREVMTRCRVAVSQLHLNGWAIVRTFERVCLYFSFRPTCHLFMYIYDISIPLTGNGFISFRTHQGHKLFGSFEESIQEFKWYYFMVLPSPGRRAFWLNDEGKPFPWVYWNRGVKDFTVQNLDPLEMVVCDFLLSLPAGLTKKNDFTCRWIIGMLKLKNILVSVLLIRSDLGKCTESYK